MSVPTANQLRVSVVIPAHNCAAYLPEAIESVLAQTRPMDEIVVVDDDSTDETSAVAMSYASVGVRYIHQARQGPSAARNRGIIETSGDFVAFLDGDDIWLPDKSAWQVNYLVAHPDVGLVSGHMWWWDVERNKRWLVRRSFRSQTSIVRELAVRNVVGNASIVMLRRSVLREAGLFDPSRQWGEDWELWIRIIARAKAGFIPEPLIVYRRHPTSHSHAKTWDQFSAWFAVSYGAIRKVQPVWWRPLLLARSWSTTEFYRTAYAVKHDLPRWQQVRHAGQALLSYPFEQTAGKINFMFRALVGKHIYHSLRKWLEPGYGAYQA